MRKKILAALSALALAVGMVAVATVSSSAHQGNIVANATCNTTTGNYDVTYTLSWSNVPDGVHATMSSRTGGLSFANGWNFNTWNDWTSRGDSTGSQGSIQWTEQLPGNTVGNGPWVYAYTEWSNGYDGSLKHDTRIEGLAGDCKIPTPLDASATATSVPATCQAPGSVSFSVTNATWENTTDITDGSRRAIANPGHLFPGGFSTIDVGYVIQPQLTGAQCLTLVTPPVQPTVSNSYESCNTQDGTTSTVPGSITFAAGPWTWRDSSGQVVSGTKTFLKGTYTFTATADSGSKFDAQGSTTKDFTVVVGFDKDDGACLIKVVPVKPAVTVTDVCASANDTLTVDSTQEHVIYTVTWNQDRSQATVTATVTDSNKYYFEPGTVTSWTFDFTNEPCVVSVSVTPSADSQQCETGPELSEYAKSSAFTLEPGGINVALDTNLQYTITGVNGTVYPATVVTTPFTALSPGDYSVTVVALNGFVLEQGAPSQWALTVQAGLCTISVPDPHAVDESCSAFEPDTKVPGYIWVDLSGNLANEVEYRITGNGVDFVATQEVNELPPGDYTIQATAKDGFTLGEFEGYWQVTIHKSKDCSLVTHGLITTSATQKDTTCASSGTFTLANTPGVVWYEYINGVKTAINPGTFKASPGSTVKVHAELLDSTYGWEEDAQTDWTFTFSSNADCLPTLAFTGNSGGTAGLLLAGVLLLLGGSIVAIERRSRTQTK